MSLTAILALLFPLWAGQTSDFQPAYEREGDRVEQEFHAYQEKLSAFFVTLRDLLDQPPINPQLPRLQNAAPAQLTYGYGVLPRITDAAPSGVAPSVSTFSYSWPVTETYIKNEEIKLDQVRAQLANIADVPSDVRTTIISNAVQDYRRLAADQRIVDQYVQYNRFWQRSIAQDRARFDQLTKVYELLTSDRPDMSVAIRDVLGKPAAPSFVKVNREQPERIRFQVPVYTDIEDQEFLAKAKSAIEDMWQARDNDISYALEIEFRNMPSAGESGAHIDVRAHVAKFPEDGAVLTTGGQTTYSLVGRYIALGPGDLSTRTLAHEFGHVLGFRDGYVRGYRDLGEHGFEILELTSVFDDIMSAPREGHVQAAHFKLMIDEVETQRHEDTKARD
jgi:hypothetical protein